MTIYQKALESAKAFTPLVARHPRTGKWFAIDKVLRCPVRGPFDSKIEAETAWREYKATEMCSNSTSKACIAEIC